MARSPIDLARCAARSHSREPVSACTGQRRRCACDDSGMRRLAILGLLTACGDDLAAPPTNECAAPRAVAVGPVTCVVDCDGALTCVDNELTPLAPPVRAPITTAVILRGGSGLTDLVAVDAAGVHQIPLAPPFGTGGPTVELVGLPDGIELVAGDSHACARADSGSLWCWGRNDTGQLGPSVDELRSIIQPRLVVELDAPAAAIAAGGFATCAITGATTRCWGLLGDPGIAEVPALAGAGAIAVGGSEGTGEACALAAGVVSCTHVAATGGPFTAIAATATSACAVDAAGAVTCWGTEFDYTDRVEVPATPTAAPRFARLFASGSGATYCGVTLDGAVACWGGTAWRAEPRVIWSPPRRDASGRLCSSQSPG